MFCINNDVEGLCDLFNLVLIIVLIVWFLGFVLSFWIFVINFIIFNKLLILLLFNVESGMKIVLLF